MFWKHTAWSWNDVTGNDDDDGGYLLAADHNTNAAVGTSNPSSDNVATGLSDLTNPRLTVNANYSRYISTLYTNYRQGHVVGDSSTLRVSPPPLT